MLLSSLCKIHCRHYRKGCNEYVFLPASLQNSCCAKQKAREWNRSKTCKSITIFPLTKSHDFLFHILPTHVTIPTWSQASSHLTLLVNLQECKDVSLIDMKQADLPIGHREPRVWKSYMWKIYALYLTEFAEVGLQSWHNLCATRILPKSGPHAFKWQRCHTAWDVE